MVVSSGFELVLLALKTYFVGHGTALDECLTNGNEW